MRLAIVDHLANEYVHCPNLRMLSPEMSRKLRPYETRFNVSSLFSATGRGSRCGGLKDRTRR